MRNSLYIIALGIFLPMIAPAQARIAVLGSSTAAGIGASRSDSSWVNRTKHYYQSLSELDTMANLAVPGTVTFHGLPHSPPDTTDITWAMSLNPDVVIISYPTNDILSGSSMDQYLANLRTMYNIVVAAGKKCYIATTQPRQVSDNRSAQALIKIGRDSILKKFPGHSLNFYDPLVDPHSNNINPAYFAPDSTHPNDAGHRLLFQVVVAANILSPIPPLSLLLENFSGHKTEQGIRLEWNAAAQGSTEDFIVQRSGDGLSYQDIDDEKAISSAPAQKYYFTDKVPLATQSFYRLKIVVDGTTDFSKVLRFDPDHPRLGIQRIYAGDGRTGITTTISLPKDETISLAIFSAAGMPVKQQSYTCKAPATTLTVTLPSLAAGVYFLKITAADGDQVVKSFTVRL